MSETKKKARLQLEFCKNHSYPMFVPSNGICFCCGANVFDSYTDKTVSETLITSCPVCNRSFCD